MFFIYLRSTVHGVCLLNQMYIGVVELHVHVPAFGFFSHGLYLLMYIGVVELHVHVPAFGFFLH